MRLEEGLYYILKHKIPFLEELFVKDNKHEIIKEYLKECGNEGRMKGKKFERFLAERLKHQGKIFLNVKFECEEKIYEYDIVSVLENGDCDYFEVKWNIGDINVLMEPPEKNGKRKLPRDVEMKNLLGKPKNIISYTPLHQDDVFPNEFEFKKIYFVSLNNKIVYPTREKEIFFSYLCKKVKEGWYVGKNKYKNGFYFRKTYQDNPMVFAKKLFAKFLMDYDGELHFSKIMSEKLEEILDETYFDISKEEFENEFGIKYPGLVLYQVKS